MSPDSVMHSVTLADGYPAQVYASGEGPPVLLLHGWSLDRHSLDGQQRALSPHYRALSVDRRGFGESEAPPGLAAEVDDLACILDQLAIERVHLLAVSQSTRVALRYAVAHPGRVASLVLQGAVVDGYTPDVAVGEELPLTRFRTLVQAGDLERMQREWLAHPMMSAGVTDPAMQQLLQDSVARYQGRDLLSPGTAGDPVDLVRLLPSLAVPTLIVTGALETAQRKAHAALLARTLPQSREVCIEGAGHLCNLTAAPAYNRALLDFLQSLRQP